MVREIRRGTEVLGIEVVREIRRGQRCVEFVRSGFRLVGF